MNLRFETQFKALEDSRKSLLSDLKNYPDELLNKKPAPDKWSVAQVIEHLLASEGASLKYLQKKTLDTSKAHKAGWKSGWRLFLTIFMFSVPIKFRAPDTLDPAEVAVSLKDLESQWDKTRNDTYQLLSKLPDADLDKEIWKHLISGKMNIYQMLTFFNIHFTRHRAQIERTLRQVG